MSARQRKRLQQELLHAKKNYSEGPPEDFEEESSDESDEHQDEGPSTRFDLLESSEGDSDDEEDKAIRDSAGDTNANKTPSVAAQTTEDDNVDTPKMKVAHSSRQNKKKKRQQRKKKSQTAEASKDLDTEGDFDIPALDSKSFSTAGTAEIGLDAYDVKDLVNHGFVTPRMLWEGLLRFHRSDLNPENEFSRRLGSFRHAFEEGGDDNQGAAAAGARGRRGGQSMRRRGTAAGRGGSSRRREHVSVLVKPRDYHVAPPTFVDDGMSMKMEHEEAHQYILTCDVEQFVEKPWDQTHWAERTIRRNFCYAFSDGYMRLQEEYTAAVQTFDPQAVMQVFSRHPYHVDSCLQLAEVYRTTGQVEEMSRMIEQALFTLESAWHPLFKPWEYPSVCPWTKTENRSLFTVLYRRMTTIGKSGAIKTAFALAKMALKLDPVKDPVRILLCIDYFALRAKEYGWLVRFSEPSVRHSVTTKQVDSSHLPDALCFGLRVNQGKNASVILLPNICYSRALALYHKADNQSTLDQCECDTECLALGMLPADSSCRPLESLLRPTVALVSAILMYPEIVQQILNTLEIGRDDVGTRKIGTRDEEGKYGMRSNVEAFSSEWQTNDSCVWRLVLDHELFTAPEMTALEIVQYVRGTASDSSEVDLRCGDSYMRLVSNFSERHVECWKEANILAWLYNCCRIAMTAVDIGRGTADVDIPYGTDVQKIFGQEVSERVASILSTRIILISKGSPSFFREEILGSSVDDRLVRNEFEYYGDPIIAEYGDNAQVNPEELQQPAVNHEQVFGQAQYIDGDQNALRLFFESLLPWNILPENEGHNNGE